MKLILYFTICCLLAIGLSADEPSFDLDEDKPKAKTSGDKTIVISKPDDIELKGITGKGVHHLKIHAKNVFELNPGTKRLRIITASQTEGSVRWTMVYARSLTPLNDKNQAHGTEWLVQEMHIGTTMVLSYRLVPWKNGIRDGLEKEISGLNKKDQVITAEVPWKDGKIHGIRKIYYTKTQEEHEDGLANTAPKVLAKLEAAIEKERGNRFGLSSLEQ